ncbi:hypothetical protein [uncultured Campylobacter sp.]|uniref:hypothetical protein n=1 Tax=uncultured Campylobacter sp. TaxID=218934 RepID=UPI0026236C1B|nr:hypothetical protein [uncultured Campylobacter sp.]
MPNRVNLNITRVNLKESINEVDKILKDAAKIADELYPTYGHVQTPIKVLSFYRQKAFGLHRDDL